MLEAGYERNIDEILLPKRAEMYKRKWVGAGESQTGSLMLLDTLKERDIHLGDSYKFDPLKQGECIISSTRAS